MPVYIHVKITWRILPWPRMGYLIPSGYQGRSFRRGSFAEQANGYARRGFRYHGTYAPQLFLHKLNNFWGSMGCDNFKRGGITLPLSCGYGKNIPFFAGRNNLKSQPRHNNERCAWHDSQIQKRGECLYRINGKTLANRLNGRLCRDRCLSERFWKFEGR